MEDEKFSFMPISVVLDHRLTLIQTRVLIALFSFRGKNTNCVWPKRKSICERTGYSEKTISVATSELVLLGWLKKHGSGGKSQPTKYEIIVPDGINKTEAA